MGPVAIIPAYQAASSLGDVVSTLLQAWPEKRAGVVWVVDDGSTDSTAEVAKKAGARVVRHRANRGKGFALRTGFAHALAAGASQAVTLDADGQHPIPDVIRVAFEETSAETLVLGVRDLVVAGAPRANQFSNAISNYFLSLFSGRPFRDTNCGLRRYPIAATLGLGAQGYGFGYEAEVVMRAARAGWTIRELPVQVYYPPEELRGTHFNSVQDPARIVFRVLATLATSKVQNR